MKKTTEELIAIIKKYDLLELLFNGDLCDAEIEDEDGTEITDPVAFLNLGELVYKDSREDTSEFWSVIHFKDHDVYLKIEGEYDSYGQYEHRYDSVKEVFPKEVKQIVYK